MVANLRLPITVWTENPTTRAIPHGENTVREEIPENAKSCESATQRRLYNKNIAHLRVVMFYLVFFHLSVYLFVHMLGRALRAGQEVCA